MKNSQKGITLIALIITIIVLLLLAVVAIGAVTNDGIINYAKNARGEYGQAQVNENTTLQNYLDKIKENVPTSSGSEKIPTGEETKTTFTISNNGEVSTHQIVPNQTWEKWCEGRTDYYVNNHEVNIFFISPNRKFRKEC